MSLEDTCYLLLLILCILLLILQLFPLPLQILGPGLDLDLDLDLGSCHLKFTIKCQLLVLQTSTLSTIKTITLPQLYNPFTHVQQQLCPFIMWQLLDNFSLLLPRLL